MVSYFAKTATKLRG